MKNLKSKAMMLSIAVTAGLFIFGGSLFAQPGDMGPRGPMKGKRPAEKLKFDDEQKQELKKLGEQHREKMKGFEEENQKLHNELFGLLKEDTSPDKTKADSLIELIAENTKKMNEAVFSHLTDIKNLCKTDEQRKLFGEFIDDFGKMHGPPPMQPPPPEGK